VQKVDGNIAQLATGSTPTTKWYYVATADATVLTNIDIIYGANKDLPAALALFHLVVVLEAGKGNAWFNSTLPGDYIKLAGTTVPTGTGAASLVRRNVGVPGESNAVAEAT
jgi:hypothetical protein